MAQDKQDKKDPFTLALVRRMIRMERMLDGLAKHSPMQSGVALRAYARQEVSDAEVEKYIEGVEAEAARDIKSEDYRRRMDAAKSEKVTAGASA